MTTTVATNRAANGNNNSSTISMSEETRLLLPDNSDAMNGEKSEAKEPEATTPTLSRPALIAVVTAFFVLTVVSTVLRKLVIDSYGQRLAFFRQISGNLFYNIQATIAVAYAFFWTKSIDKAQLMKFPLYYYAIAGLFDGLADFLTSVGGVSTPGSLQTLLSQLPVPLTMVLSLIFLSKHYSVTRFKFAGALVIVAGVALATVPQLKKGGEAEGEETKWYSIVVFIIGQIPTAASVVTKSWLFTKGQVHVFLLTCLVSWTQLCISFSFAPLQSLSPALGGIPLSDYGAVLGDGFSCFAGVAINDTDISASFNSNSNNNNNVTLPPPNNRCGEAYVPLMTLTYAVLGFFQGISQLMIVKYHSAALAIICLAVTLPMSNLAFSVPAFVKDPEPFSWYDLLGVAFTVVGLVTYQWEQLPWSAAAAKRRQEEEEREKEGAAKKALDDAE